MDHRCGFSIHNGVCHSDLKSTHQEGFWFGLTWSLDIHFNGYIGCNRRGEKQIQMNTDVIDTLFFLDRNSSSQEINLKKFYEWSKLFSHFHVRKRKCIQKSPPDMLNIVYYKRITSTSTKQLPYCRLSSGMKKR